MLVSKGEWVLVHNTILEPKDRAPQIPEDTKKFPLEMWTKGFLLKDSNLNEVVEIETIVGRKVKGKLIEKNPIHSHNYGDHIPEILQIGKTLKTILFEEGDK